MPAVASRIKDIESKYYIALRFSIYRNLGTIIAANPSTILAIARLGDREKQTLIRDLADGTLDSRGRSRPTSGASFARKTRRRHKQAARALDRIVDRARPPSPQGLLAQPPVPLELDGRDHAGVPARLSRVLRRDAGARRRTDRLGRTDDDPDRRRHRRRRSRYPPPLLRVHPRRSGRSRRARMRRVRQT